MNIKKILPKTETAKKRVAAYCRVSTLREQQEESFEMQRQYYQDMILTRPDWKLVRLYLDRRSATKVKNRPGFQKMLADAEAKKLDLILCKSVSRFARNIVDCQKYVRRFQTLGITIFFEEQNISTDDPTCGFLLSMMSAVAQDESHSISRNVRASYESRFARGEYNLGNHRILGYDCVDGKLVPNQDAWIIREIFDRFLKGQTYREISDGIVAMGAKSLRGNDHFMARTLRYMLSNETYVGDKLLQKQPPQNYLTKKSDLNCEYRSYYVRGDHEGIVEREVWEKVQEKLKSYKYLNTKDRQTGGKLEIPTVKYKNPRYDL